MEKPKRPKKINSQEIKIPSNIRELIAMYDLDNLDIYEYLDYLVDNLDETIENLNLKQENVEDAIDEVVSEMKGTVLYENSTGSSTSVTLSQSVANFDYIEIYFAGVQGSTYYYDFNKINNPNNQNIALLTVVSGADNFYFIGARGSISNTTLSLENNRRVWFSHDSKAYFDTSALIHITKVIGYKY